MIRPNHACAQSHSRTTHLCLLEDGVSFVGSSLPVLFDAFREVPVWYTLAYGDHPTDRYDENVVLVPTAGRLPGSRPHAEGGGPLTRWLPGTFAAEEYLLDDAAMARLGVVEQGGGHRLGPDALARHLLHLHDDCFAWVQPADPEERGGPLLERLLLGVLRLHAFYLGREVDWGDVPWRVATALRAAPADDRRSGSQQEIQVHSDPRRSELYVEPSDQGRRRNARAFLNLTPPLLPYLGVARVRADGRAEWEDGNGEATPER